MGNESLQMQISPRKAKARKLSARLSYMSQDGEKLTRGWRCKEHVLKFASDIPIGGLVFQGQARC